MNVLVLNCGSSSLKFQLIATDLDAIENNADRELARGLVERIGSEALLTLRAEGRPVQRLTAPLRDHRQALDHVLRWLVSPKAADTADTADTAVPGLASLADVHAVGHRVVHGGEKLTVSVRIHDAVIEQIEDCIDLAPLHNPANLRGIRAAREVFGPGIPQAAVFDTSFHSTMPPESFLYALPYQLYVRHRVRRYGFHGTSHRFVAFRYRQLTGRSHEETNIITLHLGNGCSACAIRHGDSLETSKLDTLLNKRSGLLGISGLTNDMRELLAEEKENQDRRARLAIDIFCLRIKKYLGAYLARMNGADAIVFTGGIGENSPEIRRRICADLDFLGITVDPAKNEELTAGREGEIGAEGARVRLYVIPTNEELLIARDTIRCILDAPRRW